MRLGDLYPYVLKENSNFILRILYILIMNVCHGSVSISECLEVCLLFHEVQQIDLFVTVQQGFFPATTLYKNKQ